MHHLLTTNATISLLLLLITAFFRIIPPLLQTEPVATMETIPFTVMVMTGCWIIYTGIPGMVSLKRWRPELQDEPEKVSKNAARMAPTILKTVLLSTLALGVLFLSNLLFSWLFQNSAAAPFAPASRSFATVFYLAEAAFLEELLYRLYLPEVLYCICTPDNLKYKEKIWWMGAVCSVVLFALSHRYLGWGAVCHGATAGLLFTLLLSFLRRQYPKSIALCVTGTVHFLYNLTLYLCM